MNLRYGILLFAVAAAFGLVACAETYAGRRVEERRVAVSAHVASLAYYDELAPYGTWVEVSYGWAWCPLDVSVGWRPYTVGRWAYTDWGWMWLSADPWGSVPYHYGRWSYDEFYGWVWIPGDVWAPAWVTWRYGGEWVGWAPLPPDIGWQIGVGFRYSSIDIDRRIDSQTWCFVPASGFLASRVRDRVAPPGRNVTLLSVTENVSRYESEGSGPAERGLRPDWISRAAGRPVPRYRVVDAPSASLAAKPKVRGREIEVYRVRPQAGADRDDRLRVNPPERHRGAPPRRLIERHRDDRRAVAERMRQERAELERLQERERRKPPPGVSTDALRRRHEAEKRAQVAREERMRQAYERRQDRFENRSRDDSAGDQERGRKRGRERGNGRGTRGS